MDLENLGWVKVGAKRPLSPTPFIARGFVISMPQLRQEKSFNPPIGGEKSIVNLSFFTDNSD